MSQARPAVAVVLHAHLPYVRHPEHERSIEERWFFEALFESYLPLVGVLERLEADGVDAPLTLSLSPTLIAMLRDAWLLRRFEAWLAGFAALVERRRAAGEPLAAHYAGRVAAARARLDRVGGDVAGALAGFARRGRLELWTTAATHAYLPGLPDASALGQLRVGRAYFAAALGLEPRGAWLPECAFEPRLSPLIARAGYAVTVLDAHGLALATPAGRGPRPRWCAPARDAHGVTFFGRDAATVRDVWSRDHGYPGGELYREYHRDLGFDLDARELEAGGQLGPDGVRLATGFKAHRVTSRGSTDKAPYEPAHAERRALVDAADFVRRAGERLGQAADASGGGCAVSVAAFDAELFGHWWYEGPIFLEHVARELARAAKAGGPSAVTLGARVDARDGEPVARVDECAASTWGAGGYAATWTGPRAAALWRHARAALRDVEAAARGEARRDELCELALDLAIREALLLCSSDWAFMIHQGEASEYATARFATHRARAARLVGIARRDVATLDAADRAFVAAGVRSTTLFGELARGELRRAFVDPVDDG